MYRDLLSQIISIKSISTDALYKSDINQASEWFEKQFADNGFETKIFSDYGNPIVWAKYFTSSDKPTAIIYGHYDVQPADKGEGWISDPFSLHEEDGRIYARGAVDNKGQIVCVMTSVFELIRSEKLGYNVVFVVEGEEESGSMSMPDFIRENKDILKVDFAYLSDGEMVAGMVPVVESGFRGGFNAQLEISTASSDVHSGIYGTGVPNALHILSEFVSGLYDKDKNTVAIPGFYDDVDEISDDIIENNRKISFSFDEYMKNTGAKALITEQGYDFYTQTGLRPTVQLTGFKGGYTDLGFKNIIPHKASCKINFRLVKSQDVEKIISLFKKHVDRALPDYVDYKIEIDDRHSSVKLDLNNEYVKKAVNVLEKTYNKKPVYKFSGGGLPIVSLFNNVLGIPVLSIPLANDDCKMHSVNENFRVEYLEKGIEFCTEFFKN